MQVVTSAVTAREEGCTASISRRRTAASFLVLASLWTACDASGRSVEPAPVTTVPVPTTAQGGDITLSGRVTAVYGAHVFVVGSGVDRVVVVTAAPAAVSVGGDVEVSGRVDVFQRQELETELGVGLAPSVDQLENSSCLKASVVRSA